MLHDFGKFLMLAGLLLVALGFVFWLGGKVPGAEKFWLGRLPGDIRIEREHFRFYFPLTTCLLISLVLALVFWLVRRWKG